MKKQPFLFVQKKLKQTLNASFLEAFMPQSFHSLSGSAHRKLPNLNPLMIQPFTQHDLTPLPEKWHVAGPDFVGIAAGKSGTSWWYSLLLNHPQIVNNRLDKKELHYFPHFNYRSLSKEHVSTYRMAFAAPEGAICGEWSPDYLFQPFCIEHLAAAKPTTKILVLLRNPVDRMISHLNHVLLNRSKFFNFNLKQHHVFETFSLYPEAVCHSLYYYALKNLTSHFNRNQILILQYEKCKADPLKEIARTYTFLEIDDYYEPNRIKKAVNKIKYRFPLITTEERKRLANYFSDDVQATVEIFPEIDISFWEDFL